MSHTLRQPTSTRVVGAASEPLYAELWVLALQPEAQMAQMRGLFRDRYKGSLVVDDWARLKAMVYRRESNSAFLDLNSSSERIPL